MPPLQSVLKYSVFGVLLLCLVLAWFSVSQRSEDALVVYCAHDLILAEKILNEFEEETGIKVVVVGDSEATKSLGLVQRLIREKKHPKCDVFWNNQLLGTMDLAAEGVLLPYQATEAKRIPDQFKDPNGLWTGFAGRLRVWIFNTDLTDASSDGFLKRYEESDLSRMAIAMPLYGTTLSHFSVLWETMGAKNLKEWFKDLKARRCHIVPGNSTVKNLVSEQVCDFGWTDTDDFFVGLDAGSPVAMVPIRVNGKTLCLPNTVAMIKGTKRKVQAAQLIEFLLSEQVEIALAKSGSRQIPLGPVDESQLPDEVVALLEFTQEALDITQYADARKECLEWMQSEQLR